MFGVLADALGEGTGDAPLPLQGGVGPGVRFPPDPQGEYSKSELKLLGDMNKKQAITTRQSSMLDLKRMFTKLEPLRAGLQKQLEDSRETFENAQNKLNQENIALMNTCEYWEQMKHIDSITCPHLSGKRTRWSRARSVRTSTCSERPRASRICASSYSTMDDCG